MGKINIQTKRAYDRAEKDDGFRILIDRLWPRGVSKQKAQVDLWLKAIAPSNGLRKWFSHDPKKWPEFQKRYRRELQSSKEAVAELKNAIRKEKRITLLFAAADPDRNNAVALRKIIKI